MTSKTTFSRKPYIRNFLGVVLALVIVAVLVASCSTKHSPQFNPLERITYPDGLSYTFIGNTNLLFTDGEDAVLIDGWFSRFPAWALPLPVIESDEISVLSALEKLNIRMASRGGDVRLLGVIPAHSHFDHALDSSRVASLSGAKLIGSQTSRFTGGADALLKCAAGAPPGSACFYEALEGREIPLGRFAVTVIRNKHLEHSFPLAGLLSSLLVPDGELEEGFEPPAGARGYPDGVENTDGAPGSYSIIIAYDEAPIAHVHASTNYVVGAMADRRAGLVFLSTAGLPHKDDAFACALWAETVGRSGAGMVVPIHWDGLTAPLGETATDASGISGWIVGGSRHDQMRPLLEFARRDGIDIRLPEMWAPVPIDRDETGDHEFRPCPISSSE